MQARKRGRQEPVEGFGRLTTVAIFMLAGFMVAVSAIAAGGADLRVDRSANLRELVATQSGRNQELRGEAEALRAEVDELRELQKTDPSLREQVAAASVVSQTAGVEGPAVRVVLDDAPIDVRPEGVDDDALIVHQQDIQMVVNSLWASGAEAMSIQGQRVVATTGIKCVGNSVVLHGVPYAPPYVIEAIGPQEEMMQALKDSKAIQIYLQYVEAYGLGYHAETVENVEVPDFVGAITLENAVAADA